MTVAAKGLAKLVEELGELLQVLGKRLAYYHDEAHPDGGPPLDERMCDEVGDVLAALVFAQNKFNLNQIRIRHRAKEKLAQYNDWDAEEGNNANAVDAHPALERVRAFAQEVIARGKTSENGLGQHLLELLGEVS